MKQKSHSLEETQKIAFSLGEKARLHFEQEGAAIFALQGELGSGKTTFAQGFAAGLGIKDKILSPPFLIMKAYSIPDTERTFYHIDCYRIEDSKDLLGLGWKDIVQDPSNIVLVEWPERIQDTIPQNATLIKFQAVEEAIREITIQN